MRIGIDARPLLDGQASGVGTYARGIFEALFRLGTEHSFILFSNAFRGGVTTGGSLTAERKLAFGAAACTGRPAWSRELFKRASGGPSAGRSSAGDDRPGAARRTVSFPPDSLPAGRQGSAGEPALESFSKYQNVRIKSFRIPNKLFHASIALTRRPYIDEMLGGVDLMFFPNIHFVAVSPRVPVVSVFFDVSYLTHRGLLSAKRRAWHRLVNPRRLAERSNAIVTLSRHSKENIVTHVGVAPDRVHVIPPGCSEPPPGHLSPLKQDTYIAVLSDLEPRKNINSVIEAVRRVNMNLFEPVRCVIVGREGWNTSYVKALHRLAEKNPSIEFRGYVSEQEKWNVLAGAKAFVYASFEEGFGFPPLEAMRVGTPVIASSLASLPEVLGNAAFYVNPYDASEIAHGLSAVLTDASLQETLIARGRERATLYSWDRSARSILQLFHNVGSACLPVGRNPHI
ncbi:MAG: glycosyltransferase family 4 protein [Candidatus Kerfeldbacteria bacterium]|nr:glycosyltransferase family 4 protein [Candidatus Kerfeldbacteria bacterium]